MASLTDMVGSGTERTTHGPEGLPSGDELSSHLRPIARPFVLISERELSVLRRGLTKQGWKRALYLQPATDGYNTGAGLLARANQWLERSLEIPERGGHFHNFFCEDGTKLEAPVPPEIKKEGYRCPACGRVYGGEPYDGALRCLQNQTMAAGALSLALVYGIEKDREYAAKAAEILLGYARKYPGPHTSALEGGQMYQSLDEATWIIRLAQAYDLIYHCNALHDEGKKLIEQRLFQPCAEGLINVGVQGNWRSWHLSAVGVVGLAIKNAEFVAYALEQFARQMKDELGEDGLWPESVHCYHFFALMAFVDLAEACYRAGIDLYNWEAHPGRGLKAMFTAPISYAYPSLQLPAINDGWYESFLPLGLYEIAYRRWGSPAFAWVLKNAYRFGDQPINAAQEAHRQSFKRSSFYAFLFGRDLPGRVASPALNSTNFPSLGICTLRSGGTMATFDYGPFLGHGQLDKMGITIYGADRILAPDYGTPGYGSKILRYYLETSSHNTVVVDGKAQERTSEKKLLEFRSGDLLQVAEAETEQAYPGVLHRRRLLMIDSNLIVSDRLESDEEHTYDWILHAEGEFVPGSRLTKEGPAALDYECADGPESLGTTKAFAGKWESEESGLELRMWLEAPGRVLTCGFPAETAARLVPTVVVRRQGKTAEYLSLLWPYRGPGSVECSVENGLIKIGAGRTEHWIYLADAPGFSSSDTSRLKSDALAAVVETLNGQPVRCAFLGGKEIIWNKQILVESSDYLDHFEAQLQARSPIINYTGGDSGYLKLRSSCRAMRLNGHRVSASNSDGIAILRLLPKPKPQGVTENR